jgi:DNA-binding response OmpR family regulator
MSTSPDRRAPVTLVLLDGAATGRLVAPRLAATCDRLIEVATAEEALAACSAHVVDLVVTSARLGEADVKRLCAGLTRVGGPPVIAYGIGVDPDAHIGWLSSGVLDCLSGDDAVLLGARCRAVLRRAQAGPPPASPGHHDVDG